MRPAARLPTTYAGLVSSDHLVGAVSQIADGLDLAVVLDRLVHAARDATGAHYAAIGVLGPDGLHEEFRHVGLTPDQVAHMGELPRGHGVLGLITREVRTVVTPDIASHPASVGFPAGHPPMGSFLGVPLRVRGQVFGNLYLTDKPGGFDDDDLASVEALAAAASVAVDNARLYRAARDREAWAEASGQVTAALLGGLEEEALQRVAGHARRVADADAAALALPGIDSTPVVEVVDGAVDGHALLGMGLTALRALGHTATCPMTDGEGEAGVLVLIREDGHRRFGRDDVAGAEGFAAQASLSLRLAAQRRRARAGCWSTSGPGSPATCTISRCSSCSPWASSWAASASSFPPATSPAAWKPPSAAWTPPSTTSAPPCARCAPEPGRRA